MNLSQNLLNSVQGRKMVANLIYGYESEKRNGIRLTEGKFIQDLPKQQKELYNLLSEATDINNSFSFAIDLIKGEKITFKF